jgi:hypothetical protein
MSEPASLPVAAEDEAPAASSPAQPAPTPSDNGGVKEQLEAIQRAERMQMQAAQPPTIEAQIAVLPQEAQAWLRAHPDYWADKAKNRKLSGLHGYLTDTKGIAPFSTEYFDRLESELGLRREPAEPVVEKPAPAPPRSVPYAAPVTRGAPDLSSGRSMPQRITLDPSEVEMAHLSYRELPKPEAERLYAQMKARLMKAKAAGEI